NILSDGIPSIKAYGGNAAGQYPMFTISNKTQADGVFYIKGSGASLGTDQKIYMVNDEDATKKSYVKAYVDTGDTALSWDGTANAWKGPSVTAGASQDISLSPMTTSEKVPPGKYTVTIELLTPSV
ncbi:hypothetical protein ACSN7O_004863, partial [Enterobacter chuandaensis]